MKKILKNLAAAAMLGLVFCTGVTSHASNGNVVLVLDPGHDVHDAGARRTWNGVTYAEETITLKMAQYCKEELEKYSGIVVYMTRFSNNVDRIPFPEHLPMCQSQATKQIMLWKQEHLLRIL